MTCILPTTWNVNFALVDEREENITQEESYELGALISKLQLGDDEISIKTYIQMEGEENGQSMLAKLANFKWNKLRIFGVVTALPYSTLIFNSLTINVRHNVLLPSLLPPPLLYHFFHILTITKFKHVTST